MKNKKEKKEREKRDEKKGKKEKESRTKEKCKKKRRKKRKERKKEEKNAGAGQPNTTGLLPSQRPTRSRNLWFLLHGSRTTSQGVEQFLSKLAKRRRYAPDIRKTLLHLRQLKRELLAANGRHILYQVDLDVQAILGCLVKSLVLDADAQQPERWLVAAVYKGKGFSDDALHPSTWDTCQQSTIGTQR
jgi:hypothetical protein